jgi:amino-acid N-acetyltransferase
VTAAFDVREARADDAPAIRALVSAAALPLDGIDRVQFMIAEHAGAVVGCAGLEVHGGAALLRSVAVHPDWRGHHIGDRLVRAVLDEASARRLDPVVLLTTTAPGWFPRFGFAPVTRNEVPAALHASAEFAGACPASAIVMCRSSPSGPSGLGVGVQSPQ